MATLYVDSSIGDNSRTYAQAQNASTPWLTIARAAWGDGYAGSTYGSPNTADTAQAGDTVLIAAGTYTENGYGTVDSSTRFAVALNPANSGTSANPITFRGVGTVNVRLANTMRGPTIGANGKDYIIWDNITIDDTYCGSVGDTGPVFFGGPNTGCQLINSDISGHNGSYNWGYATYTNNYNAIRLEHADSCTIRNNSIHRIWGTGSSVGSGNINDAGIMTYSSTNCVIEHNEFYDCGIAIEIKGVTPTIDEANQHDITVRYNWVHDNVRGIRLMLCQDALIYQNIIATTPNMPLGFGYDGSSVPTAATRARIVNNTIYNSTGTFNGAVYPEGVKMREPWFKNNIIHTATHAHYNFADADPSLQTGSPQLMEIDRNLYYNVSGTFALYNQDFGGTSISFATWQGTYGLDTNGSNGTDPQFVSGTPTTASDFKLASNGQSALTLGRVVSNIGGTTGDTIPVGAYITGSETIGVISGATTGSPILFI